MLRKLRPRSAYDVMAAIGCFAALFTGGAYAANEWTGENIVDESLTNADVQNGSLLNGDLAPNSITSTRIASETVHTSDILNTTIANADLAPNSITSTRILNNTLTGDDVNESSLGKVPDALVAGKGRWNTGGSCDPDDNILVNCGSVSIDLPVPAAVLVTAMAQANAQNPPGNHVGHCRSRPASFFGGPQSVISTDADTGAAALPMVAVFDSLGPGTVDFLVECNQPGTGGIRYENVGITAVAISPD